jgi:GDP-L-fucose synthase
VSHWFKANRPEYVFLVAGTVGGIMANSTRPAEFIYDNMMIHGTVVHAAHEYDTPSCCTSARRASTPATPAADHRGAAPHRAARADQRVVRDRQDRRHQAVPGVPPQYGCDFISAMPTNLYGPGDNFDLDSATCCRR